MSVLILDRDYDELLKLRRKNRKNKKLQEKCKRLTNNWNELEEWLAREYIKTGYEEYYRLALKDLYDKMKEIKEGNND